MKEILSKLLPVSLICAAVLLLMASCSQDESIIQWEEDTLCTPVAFEFTEEELSWPEPSGLEFSSEEYRKNWRRWRAETERATAIRPKYEDLFWRQPNVHGVGVGVIEDENGEDTGQVGFVISVTEKVDQSTLPPEDRIPDCLEGIAVQFLERPRLEFPSHLLPLANTEENNGND